MLNVIKHNLYKITTFGVGDNIFVESETKKELFQFIIEKESKGVLVTSINLINSDGTTPKLAFKGDKEYKALKKLSK